MTTTLKKDTSIETLRGLAIILVVIGHVIGSDSDGGMKVEDDSFLRHFYFTFEYLRMPLFTVISGWVYALRPANSGNLLGFNLKKIRRLFLPLICVGGTYYILQSIIPGTNYSYELKDVWRIIIYPYTFYWYLQALFIVFLLTSVIDTLQLANSFKGWVVLFLLSLMALYFRNAFISEAIPNYFGFKGGLYLMPFFVLGVGIQRFKRFFQNKIFIWICSFILIDGVIFQQLVWYGIINSQLEASSGIGLLIGLVGVIVILRINFTLKWLVWIGSYAYTIYLFHSFGTSGARILMHKLGLYHTVPVFFFSLFMGIFMPIIVEETCDRFALTRHLFLGRRFVFNHSLKLKTTSN